MGASWLNDSGNLTNITWAGGQVMVTAPLALAHGSNTLTFAYTSLPGPDHAGFQGTGDEGWGLENVQVTGAALAGGVPEPATWGLMIVGFGGMGAMMRRQRRLQPALARI
ncbi:MAG: PEPxxWA-CTERM sorting domain-containing protein [Phenylobacterium sp.]